MLGTQAAVAGAQPVELRTARSPWLLVLALGVGIFVGGFDQTFVVTILPDILKDIQLPVSRFGDASWIISGYLLGYTVAMPLMGRIADVFGHVRLYCLSLLLFMLGSVAVALSPSLWWIVVFRGMQAIGGGALVPISMAMAVSILPRRRRPLAIGSMTALDDASSLLGPLWGAWWASHIGWRGLFWLNLPLAMPILVLVPLLAREVPRQERVPVDWTGGFMLTLGLTLGTVALTDNGAAPRPLWMSVLLGAAGLALLAAFTWRELRIPAPMLDLRYFRQVRYLAANALYFVVGAGLITAMVCVPLISDTLYEESALTGGLNLMRMMLFMPLGGVIGGLLATRLGYRTTAALAMAMAGVGFLLMRGWSVPATSTELWLTLGVAGFGFTLADAPAVATVLDIVKEHERAAAAALLQVLQTTGMIVGMALLATQGLGRFTERAADVFRRFGLEGSEQYRAAMQQTFNDVFLVAGLAMIGGVALAWLLERGRARRILWWRPL